MSMPATGFSSLRCWQPKSASPWAMISPTGVAGICAPCHLLADAQFVEQLALDVFAAGAVGIGHALGVQEGFAQAVDGGDIRPRRALAHRAGDRRIGQHHFAARFQLALGHQLVERVADHDDHVDRLAAARRAGMAFLVVPIDGPHADTSLSPLLRS
jgi:hypothetical protein